MFVVRKLNNMTQNQIKEDVSLHFLSALAAQEGVNTTRPYRDNGTDLQLTLPLVREDIKGKRYFDSGMSITVQVKVVSRKYLNFSEGFLHYSLRAKNFNDLIYRKLEREKKRRYAPHILLIVVLNEDDDEYIKSKLSFGGYHFNADCFWYYPFEKTELSINKNSEVLKIPLNNRISLDSFKNIFNLLFQT